jgi:hypothetical protein
LSFEDAIQQPSIDRLFEECAKSWGSVTSVAVNLNYLLLTASAGEPASLEQPDRQFRSHCAVDSFSTIQRPRSHLITDCLCLPWVVTQESPTPFLGFGNLRLALGRGEQDLGNAITTASILSSYGVNARRARLRDRGLAFLRRFIFATRGKLCLSFETRPVNRLKCWSREQDPDNSERSILANFANRRHKNSVERI